MKRPHLVPLSTQALEIVQQLKVMSGQYPLVFPGRNDCRLNQVDLGGVKKRGKPCRYWISGTKKDVRLRLLMFRWCEGRNRSELYPIDLY